MQGSVNETATVLKTEGTSATVITNKSKSCKECGKARAGICGKSGSGMIMTVENSLGAEKGDTVEIGLEKKTHVKAYFIAFVLPVILLFLATYTGHFLSQLMGIEGLDVIAGLTGLIIAIICSLRKIYRLDKSVQMQITKILHGSSEYRFGSSPEEIDYLHAFSGRGY
jgi:sigma-E factor negative regulatory protein RseC